MSLLLQDGSVFQPVPPRPLALPRPDLVKPLATVQREAIESALILCAGNRTLAAHQLGISSKTLFVRMKKYRSEE
jgi:DNA-binding NtrC family response regulator